MSRILLIEPTPLLAEGIVQILAGVAPQISVDLARSAPEALASFAAGMFDGVIIDEDVDDLGDLSHLVGDLHQIDSGVRIVVLATLRNHKDLRRVLIDGVTGYLARSMRTEEFVSRVKMLTSNQFLHTETVAGFLITTTLASGAGSSEPLTSRELSLLLHMADGRSNAEIAQILILSSDTIKSGISVLFRKLGVETRAAAVAKAIRQGLIR